MDAETLERLLLDRALSGLSPDVEALLAAYLEHDAAAATRGREFTAAADWARQALQRGAPAALPAFPAAQLRSVTRVRWQLSVVRKVAGIAAALVLGVGLGAGLFPRTGEPAMVMKPSGNVEVERGMAIVSAPSGVPTLNEFWSAERLYEQAQQAKRTQSDRLIWDSPVGRPRLGGRS